MEVLFKHLLLAVVFIAGFILFAKADKFLELSVERTDLYKFVPKESFDFFYRVVGMSFMIVIAMMIIKHQI